jgi:hypothetical protein
MSHLKKGKFMFLAFIEKVELLCDVHVQQTSESGKDICNAILALVVKNAREEFTEDLIHVEVANDDRVTLR